MCVFCVLRGVWCVAFGLVCFSFLFFSFDFWAFVLFSFFSFLLLLLWVGRRLAWNGLGWDTRRIRQQDITYTHFRLISRTMTRHDLHSILYSSF